MSRNNKNIRRARILLALYAVHKIANGANPAGTLIRTGIMDVESSRRVAGKAASTKKKTESAGGSSARASGVRGGTGKIAKLALRAVKVI